MRYWTGAATLPTFAEKLTLVLKLLSISRSALASQLQVDKSVISRWLAGERLPSAHNLARLSNLIATRQPGFCTLDWERDVDALPALFRQEAEPGNSADLSQPVQALAIDGLARLVETAAAQARAYEGFFQTTRAAPMRPGTYLREHSIVRRDPSGLLRSTMGSAAGIADGWMIPHQSMVYSITTDRSSGALLFGMFHHRFVERIDVLDGLVLIPGADMGRSPTACGMICERIGELSGDTHLDELRFAELASRSQAIDAQSIPEDIRDHLARGSTPAAMGVAAEWLLNLTLNRSRTRGSGALSDFESS